MKTRQFWLPSTSVLLWLIVFLVLTLSDWRLVMISADGDPSLHWRIGDWMLEHRQILRSEQFSHTRWAAPVISKEWLSEIMFAAAGKAAGWNGIVLLSAFLIATTVWLLHRQLLAQGTEVLLATALVLLAAFACSAHWLARPHLVTHVLTVIFAWQLRSLEAGEVSGRRLVFTLAPLMLLWTNLHGAFFVGFVIMAIYALGGRRRAMVAGVLTACVAVSLANPNGWQLHMQVVKFLRTPELAGLVNEFRSPNFHNDGMRGFVLLLLAVAGLLLVVRPRLARTEWLMLGVWGYFALHSARNVPIFALVATPILAAHWQPFLQSDRYRKIAARVAKLHEDADGRIWAVLAVVTLCVLMILPRAGMQPVVSTEILTNRFPVAAVAWVRANPDVVAGEMFNDYAWGGYLMLELPERRVFVDGRNDFYGKELIDEFNTVDDVKPGWDSVFDKYRVGWTILPPNHGLNALLALQPDWRRVYVDDVAVIYGRR